MDPSTFSGETNIINLMDSIEVANHWWGNLCPATNEAYDRLMANEAFWSYPSHHEFSRLAHWHQLGNA